MIDGIEDYYHRIADFITSAIDEPWKTAKLEAVFYEGSSTYLGEYTRPEGSDCSFAVGMEGGRIFRQLRKEFESSGKPRWGQALFTLEESGSFKLEWGYDNCDENGYTIFDEELERQNSLDRTDRLTRP